MNEDNKKSPNETGGRRDNMPPDKETVIAKKKKRLKIAIIISISTLILIYAAVNGLALINESIRKNKQEELDSILKKTSITFYPEDYDANIFDNADYMDLNRLIKYINDAESYYLREDEDLTKYSYELKFMVDLVNKIIQGDADGYNAAFVDNYWKNNPDQFRERFTMQMLYNTEIELLKSVTGDVTTSDGDGTFYYVNTDLKVSYELYHNNGSFRVDLPERSYIPVVYKIWAKYRPGMLEPFEIKVYEVIEYVKYESGLYD